MKKVGPIKNLISLIVTMLNFFKKIKKNTCRYNYFTPLYQNSQSYDLQFLRYWMWQTEIMGYFLPFYQTKNQKKIGISKKWRLLEISWFYTAAPKTLIIWYTVPEIRSERQNFLSFWTIFWPFTIPPPLPLTTWKIKMLKKWKKHLEISPFTKNYGQVMCSS